MNERSLQTNMSGVISNWSSIVETVQPATSSALGDDTNLIVFVHGINVGDWDWLTTAIRCSNDCVLGGLSGEILDTVRWPCNYLTPFPDPFVTSVFNLSGNSKLIKPQSTVPITSYLNQLHTRFSGYRLNLLVHSQGNAAVSEAIKQGAPFDTYILSQFKQVIFTTNKS